jgi:patatin-like phospholipase/acyl hydrolase
MNHDNKFRIISLDGGGIRGIITVELLEQLTKELGRDDWLESVDLIAGTSTGGLIALGLASGLPLSQIKDLYLTKGKNIFYSSLPRWLLYLKNLLMSRYSSQKLREEIKAQFPNDKLGDLERKVLISAYDLDGERGQGKGRWKAKFFHNFKGKDNGPNHQESDWYALVRDVALYTASAPVYFPAADAYVDGGVVAPNPCMAALAQTQDPDYFRRSGFKMNQQVQRKVEKSEEPELDAPLIPDDVLMLSLGTGENPQSIKKAQPLAWGYLRWIWPLSKPGAPLLSLMLDGDTNVATYQCTQLLGDSFRRLQIPFDRQDHIDMDQADLIPLMQRYVDGYVQTSTFREVVDWLSRNWL